MPSSSIQARNGETPPTELSIKCRAVWEYLNDNRELTVAEIREVGRLKGWNDNNTRQEYYRWRKYHGLTKR
ncbi:hypothetical protein [Sphingomonas colocasiae]|uniref:Uncharacterized protein n=1 Tax=Sphingomonas colocasiae TaxID=1848973 RepID=A0ABS7PLP1_9SPHN|nr:hypothetical protein [Sphingomonas colocasiae]MBY8821387.1 hypothetical protein [Sphingomonas colocasiae]